LFASLLLSLHSASVAQAHRAKKQRSKEEANKKRRRNKEDSKRRKKRRSKSEEAKANAFLRKLKKQIN
jgi:hypothetical protein